jgi:hypothetical protein
VGKRSSEKVRKTVDRRVLQAEEKRTINQDDKQTTTNLSTATSISCKQEKKGVRKRKDDRY